VVVSSSADFSGSGSYQDVYTVPAGKYCDFYMQSIRALTSATGGNIALGVGNDDGVGNVTVSYDVLNITTGAPGIISAGNVLKPRAHTLGSYIGTPAMSVQSPKNTIPTPTVSVNEIGDPVRLISGMKIMFLNNTSASLRVTYKVIEYSTT
jgi:hypothetical protein